MSDWSVTCCFTGHRPEKLPWGTDERDPRCIALKQSMEGEIEALYRDGCRHFITGMARGVDLYFAEAALAVKERYPLLVLEAAIPFRGQADRWKEGDRQRWQNVLDACDRETLVQEHYDRGCMHRRDRYMVDRADIILAVFDGTPGGTRYTLDYAMRRRLEIRLFDLKRPEEPATRLTV